MQAQPRKDLKPPPHWRLEAVAATRRPRSLTVGGDRRRAVFIEDGDTSDVWLLDLDGDGPPERLTTGRDLMPFWGDVPPRLSPDGSTVAYVDWGLVCRVPVPGSSRAAGRRDAAGLDGRDGFVFVTDRGDTTRVAVAVIDGRVAAPPGPRRRPRRARRRGRGHGQPDGRSRLHVLPGRDRNRSDIRVVGSTRRGASPHRNTGMHDHSPGLVPDGTTIAYVSERADATSCTWSASTGRATGS